MTSALVPTVRCRPGVCCLAQACRAHPFPTPVSWSKLRNRTGAGCVDEEDHHRSDIGFPGRADCPDAVWVNARVIRWRTEGKAQAVVVVRFYTTSAQLNGKAGAYRFSMSGSGLGGPGRTLGLAAVLANAVLTVLLANSPTALATPQAPRPPDPHDVVFIGHLAAHGVPYASVPEAVTLAQVTCKILNTGSPTRIENAVMTIRGEITMRPDQVQSFAETAVSVYCPGCADRLGLTPGPLGPASATLGTSSEPPPRKTQRAGH
jgi:hypothetical protein